MEFTAHITCSVKPECRQNMHPHSNRDKIELINWIVMLIELVNVNIGINIQI